MKKLSTQSNLLKVNVGKKKIVSFSLIILFLAVLTLSFSKLVSPEAGGSDSAGYLLNSKIIRGEFKTSNLVPTTANGLNCGDLDQMLTARLESTPDCKTYTRLMSYPVGFSILHAGAITIFGDNDFGRSFSQAATFTGTLVLLYFFVFYLTRKKFLGFAAAVLYMVSKVAIFSLNSNLSDVPGAFWILAATFISHMALEQSKPLLNKKKFVFLMFLLAPSLWFMVLTREVNALAGLPLIAILIPLIIRTRAVLVVWLMLAGIPFMYLRYKVNGTWLTPSYGNSMFDLLSSKWFFRGLGNEFYFIASNIGLLVFAIFIPKLKWLFIEKVLFAQVSLLYVFYSFYQFTGETWWDGRFILSVFPLLIVLTLSRYHQFVGKYLSSKYVSKLDYSTRGIKSFLIVIQIMTLVFVNTGLHFPNSSSPYRYLIFELPTFRNVQPVIENINKSIPPGSYIVTMDLSASGRYYLGSKYKFLWQPTLEKLSYEEIVRMFPETYWVFNAQYGPPPETLRKQMMIVDSVGSHEIDILR